MSKNSKFDKFWQEIADGASDSDALDDAEKEGLRVFVGDGRCIACHSGPLLSDWRFHNIGIAQVGEYLPDEDPGRTGGVDGVMGDEFNCASKWSDQTDKGQCESTSLAAVGRHLGAFKTPGLRDISLTAPYMHTGMQMTLEETVRHYNAGGGANGTYVGTLDADVLELELSDKQIDGLVAFMKALDGEPLDASLMKSQSFRSKGSSSAVSRPMPKNRDGRHAPAVSVGSLRREALPRDQEGLRVRMFCKF